MCDIMYLEREGTMTNKEKITKEIENIMQLSTDMYYKNKYDDSLDIEIYLTSIEKWVKSIRNRIKKESVK